ncbi:MAG: hypothetical protein R2839_02345 [Thermomicrobiales bacterium]
MTADIPAEYLEGSRHSGKRRLAGVLNGWWVRLISKVHTVGDENIPPWGPLLYVSNHLHNLDPAIEYYAFPRPIHFMGETEHSFRSSSRLRAERWISRRPRQG